MQDYFMYGVTGVEPDGQEDIARSYEETNEPMSRELYRACRSADGKWVIESWSELTYVIATARDETEADFIADALNHKYSKQGK